MLGSIIIHCAFMLFSSSVWNQPLVSWRAPSHSPVFWLANLWNPAVGQRPSRSRWQNTDICYKMTTLTKRSYWPLSFPLHTFAFLRQTTCIMNIWHCNIMTCTPHTSDPKTCSIPAERPPVQPAASRHALCHLYYKAFGKHQTDQAAVAPTWKAALDSKALTAD